jgi:uncharacterized glyoxalase superfamily protein PhnB
MPSANRSADFSSLTPNVVYSDVGAAIDWLRRAFGFHPYIRYSDAHGRITHAQLRVGSGVLVLAYHAATPSPSEVPRQSVIVLVKDVDSVFARATAAGATVVAEPKDQVFGERQCALADLEGHHWWFTQHIHDVQPESWGARLEDQEACDKPFSEQPGTSVTK